MINRSDTTWTWTHWYAFSFASLARQPAYLHVIPIQNLTQWLEGHRTWSPINAPQRRPPTRRQAPAAAAAKARDRGGKWTRARTRRGAQVDGRSTHRDRGRGRGGGRTRSSELVSACLLLSEHYCIGERRRYIRSLIWVMYSIDELY